MGSFFETFPSRLIEEKERAWRDRDREFLEMQGHGLAVARGQDEPRAFSFGRTDCTENIGRRSPLVARRRWPGPAFRPSAGGLFFLPPPPPLLGPQTLIASPRA